MYNFFKNRDRHTPEPERKYGMYAYSYYVVGLLVAVPWLLYFTAQDVIYPAYAVQQEQIQSPISLNPRWETIKTNLPSWKTEQFHTPEQKALELYPDPVKPTAAVNPGKNDLDNYTTAAAFMAWTDQNREALRGEDASNAGRGASAGNVYHYSLSWRDGQEPSREHMEQTAHASIERLGLEKHQYYLVAHQDEEHKHVHIVVNLVDLESGKIANVYRDRYKLDKWANEYEKQNGVVCDNRAAKYEAWEQGKDAYQSASAEKKISREEYAREVTHAYTRADSGKGFAHALQEQGLTLAQGNKRGVVVVDSQGEVFALSRLIEGAKSRDITAKLRDLDAKALPLAEPLIQERKALLVKAELVKADISPRREVEQPRIAALALDPILEREREQHRQREAWQVTRGEKIASAKAYYRLDEQREAYRWAQDEVARTNSVWGRLSGKHRASIEEAQAKRLTLENAEWRLEEAIRGIDKNRPEWAKQRELAKHGLTGGAGKTLARDYEKARGVQDQIKENTLNGIKAEERARGWDANPAQEQDNALGWVHQQWNPEDEQNTFEGVNLENSKDQGYER